MISLLLDNKTPTNQRNDDFMTSNSINWKNIWYLPTYNVGYFYGYFWIKWICFATKEAQHIRGKLRNL